MNFDNKLLSDIESYCKLNGLDSDKFVNDLLKKAFMVEKYGEKPSFMMKKVEEKDKKTGEDIVWYQPTEEKQPEEPKVEEAPVEPVKEETDEPEFKLVEKKEKKSKKRKLA